MTKAKDISRMERGLLL